MALSIGIVGLPNVGKSTTFNALTRAQSAQAANYPFCTIEPNKAIVALPDSRLNELAKIVRPEKIIAAQVEFVDIAGLVRGASKGEGLGNQFLGNIKDTAAILHIVRCFEDSDITHVEGRIDPLSDVEIIDTELLLADLESLQKRIERLARAAKSGTDKEAKDDLELANKLLAHIESGASVRTFSPQDERFLRLDKDLRFLTNKPVIFAANVDEAGLNSDNEFVAKMRKYAQSQNAPLVKICAKIEEELAGLEENEAAEFLESLGVAESGLDVIKKIGFEKLGLINYFTAGVKEIRAWTINIGDKAPAAAGVIHGDFERGFIRAEVISYSDFIKHGGENGAKAAGAMRVEGKDYVVNDGDIMHFRFNV